MNNAMQVVDYDEVLNGFRKSVNSTFKELGRDCRDARAVPESIDRAIKLAELGVQALRHCSLVFVQGEPHATSHPEGCVCAILGAVMVGMIPYVVGSETGPENVRAALSDFDVSVLVGNSILFLSYLQDLGISILPSIKCWAVQG
jgi:hypothetical protein